MDLSVDMKAKMKDFEGTYMKETQALLHMRAKNECSIMFGRKDEER